MNPVLRKPDRPIKFCSISWGDAGSGGWKYLDVGFAVLEVDDCPEPNGDPDVIEPV